MKNIYQLSSCIATPDAVSSHVLAIDDMLVQKGISTKIFATNRDTKIKRSNLFPIENFLNYKKESDSIIINHYSVYDKSAEIFLNAKGKKIFIYHNITPHKYFVGYNDEIANLCKKGREMIPKFNSCDLAITLSEFSRQELLNNGFLPEKVKVLPYLLDFEKIFHQNYSSKSFTFIPQAKKQILFVGKIATHKKIEDTIKAFYLYQKYYQPESHLHLVGILGNDLYESELRALTSKLQVNEKITFHGRSSKEKLSALFQKVDVFITMSEHEGFCVPLVEAMYHDVPIIANASGAIPNTLGDSGIQIKEKDHGLIAEAINSLIEYPKIRQKVIKAQQKQLEKLVSAGGKERYYKVFSKFL